MKKITLPEPKFASNLVSMIVDLEGERDRSLKGSTPAWLFFDLKEIMHRLESLTSARIEGNRTTILEVVEHVISGEKDTNEEELLELKNIEEAIDFIEESKKDTSINRAFISELHKITTKSLQREGSKTPGSYRNVNVAIQKSKHVPPDHKQVASLMEELFDFINQEAPPQEHLLRVAVAHHRMAAIHPFDNGNGRTVRLLTYAMLSKYGFIDAAGFRLLNPSAIFCIDRDTYYNMLEKADSGTEQGLLEWCEFVLTGIYNEVKKIDKLLDRAFAEKNIILPALEHALEKKQINNLEYSVLRTGMRKNIFQAKHIKNLFSLGPSQSVRTSQLIRKMKQQKLIMTHPNYKTKYVIRFSNNYLLRGVIAQMAEHNLLPLSVEE